MEQQTKDLIKTIIDNDMKAGNITIVTEPTGRFFVSNDKRIRIPFTTATETYAAYKKLIIDTNYFNKVNTTNTCIFDTLPRVSVYVGKPDSGKTYQAIELAKSLNIESVFIPCRDTLTLETLLQDFILTDGKPAYKDSLALNLISDPNNKQGIIVLDEGNTMLTGVMKTLQPLFDDTSTEFVLNGTKYHKNLNCKFILTMNDKDKGINILPNAILSRSYVKYFEAPTVDQLSQWTNTDKTKINNMLKIYQLLGIEDIFGTRQIKIIKQLNNVQAIVNHLKGQLSLQPNTTEDTYNKLDTTEFANLVNQVL